jgi:hypothetical protein
MWPSSAKNPTPPTDAEIWTALIPGGRPVPSWEGARVFELYKLMVASSEALVARRQGVNTFFLTANGALLTGIGLVLKSGGEHRLLAAGILGLALAGALLAYAWRSLLISFGQLNTGKFAVITRLEELLPASIYAAEWKALAEGRQPAVYRSFTSREVWLPGAALGIYAVVILCSGLIAAGCWKP